MLTVVTGPPCSGKSTYVRTHAKNGDVIVDMDRIALALATEDTEHHDYPSHLRHIARLARNTAANAAITTHQRGRGFHAWLIECAPSPQARQRYAANGARFIHMTTDHATCRARAAAQRPPHVATLIDQAFGRQL